MDILLVGIGGTLGGMLRVFLGKWITDRTNHEFPAATFLINVSGSLLLGFLSAIHMDSRVYLLAGEGFLGAYTTFSTFMFEGFTLVRFHKKVSALLYIAASVLLGIAGFILGYAAGALIKI